MSNSGSTNPARSSSVLADRLDRISHALRTGDPSSITDSDINRAALDLMEAMHRVTACEFILSFLADAPEGVDPVCGRGGA